MKTLQKLMALAVIAGGMAFVAGTETAEAGHHRSRGHHSHHRSQRFQHHSHRHHGHHQNHRFQHHRKFQHNHFRYNHHRPIIKQAFVAPTYYHGYKVLCDAHGCYYYFDNYGVRHILPLR